MPERSSGARALPSFARSATPFLASARRCRRIADVGRSAGQAPLHGVRPAGVGAADDNVEIGTRLLQRAHIDVSALRRLPDVADALGTMGERVLEEPLRAFASLGRLWL